MTSLQTTAIQTLRSWVYDDWTSCGSKIRGEKVRGVKCAARLWDFMSRGLQHLEGWFESRRLWGPVILIYIEFMLYMFLHRTGLTHLFMYIHIFIYRCVCVCACYCLRRCWVWVWLNSGWLKGPRPERAQSKGRRKRNQMLIMPPSSTLRELFRQFETQSGVQDRKGKGAWVSRVLLARQLRV